MRILRPKDWERLDRSVLTIVVEGSAASVSVEVQAHQIGGKRLTSVELDSVGHDLWAGQIVVEAIGRFVLDAVDDVGHHAYAGLDIGLSDISHVVNRCAIKEPARPFRYDVKKTWSSDSNFQMAADDKECRQIDASGVILYEEENHDASQSLLHEYCIGTSVPEFEVFRQQSRWAARPGYLKSFDDADVYLRTGVVCDAQGIWCDGAVAGMTDANLTHYPDLIRDESGTLSKVDASIFENVDFGGPVFLVGNAGFGNFAHWMMNSLFAAWLSRDEIDRVGGKIVCPRLPYYARESLRIMGMEHFVVETEMQYFNATRVFYPSPLSTHANMFPPSAVVSCAAEFRRRAGASSTSAPELIYMTRKGFVSERKFANEDAFVDSLRKIGFVTVATHELSMPAKVSVFSKARIIIAQLGASLTHELFVPENCIVIEITTPNYHSNEYWYLARLLNLRFVRYMIEPEPEAYISSSNFEFSINIDEAVSKIVALMDFA